MLGDLRGTTIAVWGLTYKPGTDTLRRSGAIETCRRLAAKGASIQAYDPAVSQLPAPLARIIRLAATAEAALAGASALVVSTAWPEFLQVPAAAVKERMRRPLVLDAARFLGNSLGKEGGIQYLTVGKPVT